MKVKLSGETNCILAAKSMPAMPAQKDPKAKAKKFVFHGVDSDRGSCDLVFFNGPSMPCRSVTARRA